MLIGYQFYLKWLYGISFNLLIHTSKLRLAPKLIRSWCYWYDLQSEETAAIMSRDHNFDNSWEVNRAVGVGTASTKVALPWQPHSLSWWQDDDVIVTSATGLVGNRSSPWSLDAHTEHLCVGIISFNLINVFYLYFN